MVQIEKQFLHKKNKKSVRDLKEQNKLLKIYTITITILCCLLCIVFMKNNNELIMKIQDITYEYENKYNTLLDKYTSLKTDNDYLEGKYISVSNSMKELASICNELDQQNLELVKSNDQYYNELTILKGREELFDKYDYAIIDRAGNRTDITYDRLVKLEDLVAKSNIKNEDLILSWIMVESGGVEKAKNPKSTAKGFGQILDGTSKFVYTNLLDYNGWNKDVAYDGDVNIEMMVAYIDYLYEKNNGNLYEIIKDYSGNNSIADYVYKMDSYLAEANTSVKEISIALKE